MERKEMVLKVAQGNFKVIFTGHDVLDLKTNETIVIHRSPSHKFTKKELVNLCNYTLDNE